MKKIEFGYSNDDNPKGSWEGIGICNGEMLLDGSYYGVIGINGDNYIVSKITDLEMNSNVPQYSNNFVVRKAMCDVYKDGSAVLYLDQDKSSFTTNIEQYLNRIKDKIFDIDDVIKYCKDFGIHRGNKLFSLLDDEPRIISTSIKHDVFEERNDAVKNCRLSFSELASQGISRLYGR